MDAPEKSDRLIEATSVLLSYAPDRRLKAVVLNKSLFYFDLASLRDRGETITGNSYVALAQGPVVAKYQSRIVKQFESRGLGRQSSEWDGSKPLVLEREVDDFRFLDTQAKSLAAAVVSFFANATSREASDYSHENPGWILAWNETRRTGKPTAINLRIALQQIVEDDPWLDRCDFKLDDETLAEADAGIGADW